MRRQILRTNHHSGYLYLVGHTGQRFRVLDYEGWRKVQQRPRPPNPSLYTPHQGVDVTGYGCVGGPKPFYGLLTLGITSLAKGIPYVQVAHARRQRTGHRRGYRRRLAKPFYGRTVLLFFPRLPQFRVLLNYLRRRTTLDGPLPRCSAARRGGDSRNRQVHPYSVQGEPGLRRRM